MFPFYTLAYSGAAVALAPYYLVKGLASGKYLWNFPDRLGLRDISLEPKSSVRIWVHALSLGETLSAQEFINRLKSEGYDVCLSTTTRSGRQIAQTRFSDKAQIMQFPYDWPPAVRRVQDQVEPDLVVLVETDIWPNFLARLRQKKIPVVLINARVSDRSYSRYRLIKRWWKKVLNLFTFIGVQTNLDKQRMLDLGAGSDRIVVTGNLKFDRAQPKTGPEIREVLLTESGLPRGVWLVGGSTHPGEEEALLEIFTELAADFPELRLLLAPRNKSRFEQVWQLIQQRKVEAARRSGPKPSAETRVFLLDTQGELDRFYELADVVFIGKSLPGSGEGGGHNLLEPAAHFKPVLFGRRMQNFQEIARLILAGGGGIQVADRDDLKMKLKSLLADPEKRKEMGKRARAVIEAHQGAIDRNMELVKRALALRSAADR